MKVLRFLFALVISASAQADGLGDVVDSFAAVTAQTLEDGTKILADAESGLTLYTFDEDDDGVSNCFDGCLRIWPAMVVESLQVPEPFSVHQRADGDLQLVLNGEPLYFFVRDREPLDIRGDGIGDVWHIVEIQ